MANEVTAEKRREYQARWENKDPAGAVESKRKARRVYRSKHPELVKARMKRWRGDNRLKLNAYRRSQYYKSKYGLTVAERDAMIVAQNSKCKTCGSASPGNKLGWVVDHCHATNKVRGILCHDCNLALGHVKDDVAILKSLIRHLKEHQ